MTDRLFVAALYILPLYLSAQSVAIPKSGIIFDPGSQSLRPINGVPGSATLGAPIAAAGTVKAAAVCSSLQFALISREDFIAAAMFRFSGSTVTSLPEGSLKALSQVVMSPSCSAALLFSAETSQSQLITGLPNSAVMGPIFSLPLAGVSSLAVSDDASVILGVIPGSGIYVASSTLSPLLLMPIAGNAAVAFQKNQDALIADSQGNQILLAPSVLTASAPQVLAGIDQGISAPTSIAYDAEKQIIFFGNSGTSEIGLVSPTDGTVSFLGCGCQSSFVSSLGNQIYEIAAPVNDIPLLLLDIAASPYKVLFVAQR
jgi:hypothetical protein